MTKTNTQHSLFLRIERTNKLTHFWDPFIGYEGREKGRRMRRRRRRRSRSRSRSRRGRRRRKK